MTWTIARKEILSNLLSYKFFIVLLLIVLLVATSLFIMHRDYNQRMADYQTIRPKPGEPIALLAPNPLSIFAKGLDDAITRSFEIGLIGITVRAGQSSGNIIYSFFPAPDFLYVVRVVLSLVALLFGFDQVSREREQGTLKIVLGSSVSRARVLAGKWLGNFLSLSVPFLLVTLLGSALLMLDPNVHFSAGQLGRLGLVLVLSLLYLGFFMSLGMLVSALTRRAATSIVVLLFIWALFVFIIPNLGTLVARQFVSVPSVRALSEKRQQTWTREVVVSIKDGAWADHFRAISSENDKLENDYRLRFERLVRLSRDINRISPAASFLDAASEIAGTGIGEESRLKGEIVRYEDSIIDRLIADQGSGKRDAQYPAFTYAPRPVAEIFAGGALFDTVWLIFFNILSFALAYVAFVRYDVR
ncbi:MAG: ABC transporter permease subunit [Candidatus Aminicenantales bacterium]|jgi:ABC-type transport system involved in multi-copper enzyme maturation permease subunit